MGMYTYYQVSSQSNGAMNKSKSKSKYGSVCSVLEAESSFSRDSAYARLEIGTDKTTTVKHLVTMHNAQCTASFNISMIDER